MNYYNKIPIWENRRRVKLLNEFRNLVVTYFNNTTPIGFGGFELRENEQAVNARQVINHNLQQLYTIVIAAGVNPLIEYTPPPAVGGYIRSINVILNIFNLSRFEIRPPVLLDYIDRSIGIYKNDKTNALLRTLNPLFWLGLVFEYIARLPFKIIGKMGFDQEKAESSFIGKIVKGIFYVITVLAALLTILNLLGYL